MVKVLPFTFEKCFGPFSMLLVKGSSETWLFRYLPTTFFGVCKFKNTRATRAIFFFLKMFKIESKFSKCKPNLKKIFPFWDNCIWKRCNKLPLWRRVYLSSAFNGLTNSPKILHISQKDVLSPNCFKGINKYGKGALVHISTFFPRFSMLLVEESSETGLFRHLYNHVFRNP